MYRDWHEAVKLLPKRNQYTLGSRIENFIIDLLELILLAQHKPSASKILILGKADIKIQEIKLLIRLAYEIKSLPEQRYFSLEKEVVEMGKMLGGWIKATQNPAPEKPRRD